MPAPMPPPAPASTQAPPADQSDDGAKVAALVEQLTSLLKAAGPDAAKAVLEKLASDVVGGEEGPDDQGPSGPQSMEQGASNARPMGMG